ncbi:MAG: hypothetical protein WDA47_04225 [Bacilli bacterium]|jgi:hypothetical protein
MQNIFEDIERQKVLQHFDRQREMLKEYDDVLEDKNIDSETGKLSEYHRNNCSGCSLCEE